MIRRFLIKTIRHISVFLTLFTMMFLYTRGDGLALSYKVTDLGTLGGTQSWAEGVNNGGQVVGNGGNGRGFLYSGGVLVDIGGVTGTTIQEKPEQKWELMENGFGE